MPVGFGGWTVDGLELHSLGGIGLFAEVFNILEDDQT